MGVTVFCRLAQGGGVLLAQGCRKLEFSTATAGTDELSDRPTTGENLRENHCNRVEQAVKMKSVEILKNREVLRAGDRWTAACLTVPTIERDRQERCFSVGGCWLKEAWLLVGNARCSHTKSWN